MGPDAIAPLTRDEVAAAIERRRPPRVPLVLARWWGEGLVEQYGDRLRRFDAVPNDAAMLLVDLFEPDRLALPWYDPSAHSGEALDSVTVLSDWGRLGELVDHLPRPADCGALVEDLSVRARAARASGRYVLFGWWRLFFERPWQLRGMTNLMMDYFDRPDDVHRLHAALCHAYVAWIEAASDAFRPDGFWTSDDLGNQRQLMMSPAQFREFLLPYYHRVGAACRRAGMHFWLHSCGNNTEILGDLADAGLHVFHPVQKHTMDDAAVAARHGDRLTFLVGFDVQQTLRQGTPPDVRAEVRRLVDTFDRPDGGMCMAAGNGIVAGTPFENIEAFLDEAVRYGFAHRREMNALGA